jgi:hypothetical protein
LREASPFLTAVDSGAHAAWSGKVFLQEVYSLPEGIAVTDQCVIANREDATEKCVALDFVPPKLTSVMTYPATVKRLSLANKWGELDGGKATNCTVWYDPSDKSVVEIRDFADPEGDAEAMVQFKNNSKSDVNLPEIELNGRSWSVIWTQKGECLVPIASQKKEQFLEKHSDFIAESSNGKWRAEKYLVFAFSWLTD